MLNRLKEKEEKIKQVIDSLQDKSAKGILILVEGKKDLEALRTLGVQGLIMSVKTGGKSFSDVVYTLEEAKVTKVVLMLDFDRRGKEGTKRLKQDLERAKITPILEFWRELSGLVSREIQCVESLPVYLGTLNSKINA